MYKIPKHFRCGGWGRQWLVAAERTKKSGKSEGKQLRGTLRVYQGSLSSKKLRGFKANRRKDKGKKPLTGTENMHVLNHTDGLVALGVLAAHPIPLTIDESRGPDLLS